MRVLIAEDEAVSRRLLAASLRRWGCEVQAVADGEQAWAALQAEDAPRLAVLDWMMPPPSGVDICRRLRAGREPQYTYVILLTARDRKEDVVEGLDAGADDYIVKPFDTEELRVRVNAARRIINLQTELLNTQRRLQREATHDALTGLWNRSAILEALDRELGRARREHNPLGVVLADLDCFKKVNDRLGHQAGDETLRQVAERMIDVLRGYDSLGRYGGEEFLLVLPHSDAYGAAERAERIRQRLAQEPIDLGRQSFRQTLSLGVTSSAEEPTANVDALVKAADAALYAAKRAGRNRVALAREAQPIPT
jgi:diguanylate cyclase (GGDEF)-like protein